MANLTKAERRQLERIQLENLILELQAIKRDGGDIHPIIARMENLTLRSISALEKRNEIITATALEDLEDAIDTLGDILEELGPVGKALEEATEIAKTGKKELFLPSLASAMEQVVALVEAMKEGVDNVSGELKDLGKEDDVKGILSALKSILDAAKDTKKRVEDILPDGA